MALGITGAFIRTAVYNFVLFIPAVLLVRHLGGGLVALAVCWSVSRYFIALTTLQAVRHKVDLGVREMVKPLTALVAAMIVSCVVMAETNHLLRYVRLPIQFVVAGFAGTLVYFLAVWFLEPSTLIDAWNMARRRHGDGQTIPPSEVNAGGDLGGN
jgi:hypothetical protein